MLETVRRAFAAAEWLNRDEGYIISETAVEAGSTGIAGRLTIGLKAKIEVVIGATGFARSRQLQR